jgi:hypothetical protein
MNATTATTATKTCSRCERCVKGAKERTLFYEASGYFVRVLCIKCARLYVNHIEATKK